MVTRRMFFGVIAALVAPLQPVKQWTYVKLRFNSLYGKLTGYSAYGKKVPLRYYDVSSAYPYEMSNKRYYGAGSDAMRILRKMGLAKNPPHV